MSEARAADIAKELGPNVQHVFLDATEEESIAEAVTAAAVRQTTKNSSFQPRLHTHTCASRHVEILAFTYSSFFFKTTTLSSPTSFVYHADVELAILHTYAKTSSFLPDDGL